MINIKLLQTPEVIMNNEAIVFPYKKAEALFYYIAIEKTITREQAIGLLWEDNDEATAKKNLRHALYIIKKAFGFEIIICEKYKLELSNEVPIKIDYDEFISENRLELFSGGLLKGFSVKNAYSYEEWLIQMQYSVKERYLSALYEKISSLPYTALSEIEQSCSLYMDTDYLDERIYQFLIETYYENKLYHKGIKLYQRLKKILDEELGIAPNKEVTDLYHKLLSLWNENSTKDEEPKTIAPSPKIREKELAELHSLYKDFLSGNTSNVMLVGENGIGKTHLVHTFLSEADTSGVLLLSTSCFQAEKTFPFQSLNSIMMQLEDYITDNNIELPDNLIDAVSKLFPYFFNKISPSGEIYSYLCSKNSFVHLFRLVSKYTPILIFIDNINAMDNPCIQLLQELMRMHNNRIMIISTCLDSVDYDMVTFISTMIKDNLLIQIPVSKLTFEDANIFVTSMLGDRTPDTETIKNIYNETDGNLFFLSEVVNNIKNNANPYELSLNGREILNDRLNGISPEARQLLDIISLFWDHAALEYISEMQNKEAFYILNLTDELKDRALIREITVDGSVYFTFRHNKMRDFVYGKLSPSKLRILHNKAADILEQHFNQYNKSFWYKKLIYHYSLAKNTEKTLYYKILNLENYSNVLFELYPVFDNFDNELDDGVSEITSYFEQLDMELNTYNNISKNFTAYDELKARLMLSQSRYFIQKGCYEKGLPCINNGLKNSYVIPTLI